MKIKNYFFKFIILVNLINLEFNAHAATENKIIGKVENQIISSYELKNKIKTILFLSNQTMTQENIDMTKKQALHQLINHKLKKSRLLQKNIKTADDSQVNNFFDNLSSKYETNKAGLQKIFKNNNLNFDLYYNEIKTEYNWQKLIFARFNSKVSLDEKIIQNELNTYIETQDNLYEYNLAEIEISLNNNLDDKKTIIEINRQITEIGFDKAAIKYSVSTSSINGGALGWISSKSLSEEILSIISEMKIGEISKPIIQTNTATILQLLKKRKVNIAGLDLEKLRKQIVTNKKNELLNLYSSNHLSKIKNNALIEIK